VIYTIFGEGQLIGRTKTMLLSFRTARFLITVLILCGSAVGWAQTSTFKFSGDGQFLRFAEPRVESGKPVHVVLPGDSNGSGHETSLIYSFSVRGGNYRADSTNGLNQMRLTNSAIFKLNKQLAARIDLALDNLTDSVRLQTFYQTEWGSDEFTRVQADMDSVSSMLKDTANYDSLHVWLARFPEFEELNNLEDSLRQPYHPYTVRVVFNPDSSRDEIYVVKINRLQSLLVSYWTRTLYDFHHDPFTKANRPYKEAWEQIGPIAERAKYWHDKLAPLNHLSCLPPANLNSILNQVERFTIDTLNRLENNPIIIAIRANSDIYESTFWWNYGFFGFNPLGYSTTPLTYHVFLFDKEAAALHDRAAKEKIESACCNLSINGIDSVIMVRNNGAKIFSTDTAMIDPVWGFNDLRALRTTQKMVNQFEVPVTLKDARPQFYLQFDAAHNYSSNPGNKKYKRMSAEDSISFVIHNISANTTVVVNQVSQTTTNTSSFQDALASLANVSGLNTAASAVNLGSLQAPALGAYRYGARGAGVAISFDFARVRIHIGPPTALTPVLFSINLWVSDTMRSKTLLLALLDSLKFPPDEESVDYFFDHCFRIISLRDLLDGPKPETAVLNYLERMVSAFDAFGRPFFDIRQALNDLARFGDIAYLSMITDRSLPPPADSLSLLTDSTPALRSQIFQIPVYDSTRAVQATIVAKKIVKKDTTTITHPIYPSIRIGTLSRFAFSAGIAVTPGFLYAKSATVSGNQLTVTNNAELVSWLVGVHIYPCKYFPLDNSFLGFKTHHFWQRFSIYTGLGLPNPLEQYYGGASFDLVPGFKLITGAHLFLNNRYELTNNQIANQASAVKYGGVFVSFSIDPSAFVTVLGLFK
jgi:hypothetical protein